MPSFETLRAAFTALLPELERMAGAQFRHLDPDAREEAVQNTLALAWHSYLSLIRQGRGDDPALIRSVLWYSVKQTKAGRALPTGDAAKPKDVFVYAKRGCAAFERVDLRAFVNDQTPIPDAVSFRVDFPAFLATLGDRQREITLDLMDGMGTGECAARHGVTPARISQTRALIAEKYAEFVAN